MSVRMIVQWCIALLLLALAGVVQAAGLAQSMPQVQGTRRIVLEQLEQLLMADPQLQIIGQGSWLRPVAGSAKKTGQAAGKGPISRAYADPLLGGTSDHDLRLVMKGKDQAVAYRWRAAQDKLRNGIQSLFPKNASARAIEDTLLKYGFQPAEAKALAQQGGEALVGKILKSVNLYAPPGLMRAVVDEKTAAATFKKLGTVPNLAGKIVEGVWGEGTTAAIQEFESGGRLFWNSGKGAVRAGFVDLVHLSEGPGRYTLEGAANLSAQWAEKALEALHENDPALLAKYLKRLKSTLNLAARKGNLSAGAMADSFSVLDAMIANAEQGVVNVADLQRAVRGARMQASLLGELARNPGATDRQILMAILDSKAPGRFDKVGQWFRETWEAADNWVMFERAVQGVFLVYSTWQVAGTWGAQGMETALRQAGVEAAMLASLPIGAVTMLANHVIETAKEAGYDMSVRSQDWDNFLAGISSVQGCEGTTRKEMNIHQLAVDLASADEVRQAVESQATHIQMLCGFGTPEIMQGKWQALVARMRPIITAEWLRERKRIMTEYLDQALELDEVMNGTVLRAVIEPQPVQVEAGAPAGVTVRLESSTDPAGLRDRLRRLEDTIKPLGGKNRLVYTSYEGTVTWNQNGQKKVVRAYGNLNELFEGQNFSLPGRGSWPLEAEFALKISVSVGGLSGAIDVLDAKPLLERHYQRKVPVVVDVVSVARAKVEPQQKASLSLPSEIMAGERVKLSWNRSKMPGFKPGKYKVVLWPRGTQLTQQDFMLLSFDPTGQPGGVFKYPVQVLSERAEGDRIDIEVQAPQVYDIQKPEQLELAFIFMDREASLSSQLDKAMADLDKAQAEMDRKVAAMSEAEREEFIRKMEEAAEKAESQPPPILPDPSKDPVAAGTVLALPVTLKPVEIDFKMPDGWKRADDGRVNWREAQMVENRPEPGDYVYAKATVAVRLDYTDQALNDWAEGQFNENKRWGSGQHVSPLSIGSFKGEIVRRSPRAADVPRYTGSGTAFLKDGRVQIAIEYSLETTGFLVMAIDEQGKSYVKSDTRAAAAERYPLLLESVEAMLASLRIGQQRLGQATPQPVRAAATAEAPADTYVRLVAAKTQAEPGEFVEIKAVLENPKGDEGALRYEWGGNHAGDGDTVTFLASDPGSYSISVIVRGTSGVVGSTSVDIEVR